MCGIAWRLEIVLMSDIDLIAYELLGYTDRFDMSHNPQLRTLQIKFDVSQRQQDPLPWLTALRASSAPTNILANVHVIYSMYLPEASYTDHPLNTVNYTRRRDVDAVLSGGRRIRWARWDMFLEAVKVDGPALRARRVLVVEAFDRVR